MTVGGWFDAEDLFGPLESEQTSGCQCNRSERSPNVEVGLRQVWFDPGQPQGIIQSPGTKVRAVETKMKAGASSPWTKTQIGQSSNGDKAFHSVSISCPVGGKHGASGRPGIVELAVNLCRVVVHRTIRRNFQAEIVAGALRPEEKLDAILNIDCVFVACGWRRDQCEVVSRKSKPQPAFVPLEPRLGYRRFGSWTRCHFKIRHWNEALITTFSQAAIHADGFG